MNYVFSIYSRDAFRECILPSLNNSDYTITLRMDEFHLESDLVLHLEVINDQWKLIATQEYRIIDKHGLYPDMELKDSSMLWIQLDNGERFTVIVTEEENAFHSYSKFDLVSDTDITIGRDERRDIVYDFRGMVSRLHATISVRSGRATITSNSDNGIYVNGQRIVGQIPLGFGDYINIVGLHMVYLIDRIAIDTSRRSIVVNESKLRESESGTLDKTSVIRSVRERASGKTIYHRAPRSIGHIATDPIEIEAPPQLQRQKKQSLRSMVGPSITMALPMLLGCILMVYAYSGSGMASGRQTLFMYSGLVMAVSSALVGAFWAVSNQRQQQKAEDRQEELRQTRYSEYLIERTEEIRSRYNHTLNTMQEMYPDPSVCLSYDESGGLLWNRNKSHSDFLTHRLGIGEVPFPVEIRVPQRKFRLEDDPLMDKGEMIRENFRTLYDAPVTLDLSTHHLIGVIGGPGRHGAIEVVRALSLQISAANCYTDVKLGYVYDGQSSADHDEWNFARWLPHVWSEDHKTRFVADDRSSASEVFYEIANIMRNRAEAKTSFSTSHDVPSPYYVLFISDQSMLEGEMISRYISDTESDLGLTTILLAESYEQLPNSCDYIIENTGHFQGGYGVYGSEDDRQPIIFDAVSADAMERFSRRISSLRVQENEEGGELPNSLTFFDMMHIRKPEDLKVRELWAKNRTYDNIRGQIGEKVGGSPCYLDVHEKYHGPHGLVAGTTGSGKSETLQTYMLSLAINYSPDDIGFFIIDYKGGGMANLFDGLPHMVGQISNLSGNQVRRAMISIQSENRRRQRIFNENGVNNISNYTRLYKNGEATEAVPHLFIVIDEFAELKREEPEFMRELISVAQVGRSLGVHLILSTQKPSGTVDDNIWSNSKFRLCLRVQDRQDSMDMLHKPDAAYITQAGRCYLQVGNDEVYELFQSGYSGAIYDENFDSDTTDIAKLISCCGKVELSGGSVRQGRRMAIEKAWIGRLINVLKQATVSCSYTPVSAATDEYAMHSLIEHMYSIFEEVHVEYPESRFNTSRLQDFIRVYAEAIAFGAEPDAEYILMEKEKDKLRLPQAKEHTQLDAIKEYLAVIAANEDYSKEQKLWLPVLREEIYLEEFEEFKQSEFSERRGWDAAGTDRGLQILIGQWDDPSNQSQMPFTLDLAVDGNISICGSIVTGKSTSMQTIAYSLICRYSPDKVNIYALDFSSKMMTAFENAPHFGGIMLENDNDRIDKFFNMIMSILSERKTLLRGGSFRQYIQVHDTYLPAIVIMVDNYASFREKTGEKYDQTMIQLSKEGIGNGIYIIVSGTGYGINDIPGRIGENINTCLTLSLPDKYAYADLLHTMQIDMLPETGVKGRGLALYDGRVLEYQTALAVRADNDYQRMEKIGETCGLMSSVWTGRCARQIPEIPSKPEWAQFTRLDEFNEMQAAGNELPIGYNADNASVYGIPLSDTYCFGIYGNRMTGKKNLLKICMLAAAGRGADICIIDNQDIYSSFLNHDGAEYCRDEDEVFAFFGRLTPVIQARNSRKKDLINNGYEEEDLFDAMSREFRPYFIFISDMAWFVQMVYDSDKNMSGFLENILGKGSGLNMFFFAALSLENRSMVSGYKVFEIFSGYRKGIHMGGKTIDNPILNYDYLKYADQAKPLKPGIGLLPDRENDNDPSRIIIPLAKRNTSRTTSGENS